LTKAANEGCINERNWVYDLRSTRSFSLRQNPIRSDDLTDFVRCYSADDRSQRKEISRFRRFKYAEIIARDKASLTFNGGK